MSWRPSALIEMNADPRSRRLVREGTLTNPTRVATLHRRALDSAPYDHYDHGGRASA